MLTEDASSVTGTIRRMAQGVVDGNTHFYLVLEGNDQIYDVSMAEFMEIVRYDVGDEITLSYLAGDPAATVISLGDDSGEPETDGISAQPEAKSEETEAETTAPAQEVSGESEDGKSAPSEA